MKTKRMLSLGRMLSIAIIVLGVIHDVATFTPLIKGGLACLDNGNLKAMLYMSLICGTSLILAGIVLILLLRKVEQHTFLTSSVLVIGVFLALNGVLAVVYMFDNPFAWIALLLNISMFFIAGGLKIKLDKK